jgi:hypothetical protein
MRMRQLRLTLLCLFTIALVVSLTPLQAQVTTATLYGVVRDATGAVLPGASVTATNQGTNLSRDAVTDERGEFALPALRQLADSWRRVQCVQPCDIQQSATEYRVPGLRAHHRRFRLAHRAGLREACLLKHCCRQKIFAVNVAMLLG